MSLLWLVVGCEFVEADGPPWAMAPVQAPSTVAPATDDPVAQPSDTDVADADPFAFPAQGEPTFRVTSDEFAENVVRDEGTTSPEPAEAPPADDAATPAPPEPAAAPLPPATDPMVGLTPPPDWGLRLVRTMQDMQPPRAILGMPDGREIVVHPADLLAEHGLVVTAVGHGKIQLARVKPHGDHALVESFVLEALY